MKVTTNLQLVQGSWKFVVIATTKGETIVWVQRFEGHSRCSAVAAELCRQKGNKPLSFCTDSSVKTFEDTEGTQYEVVGGGQLIISEHPPTIICANPSVSYEQPDHTVIEQWLQQVTAQDQRDWRIKIKYMKGSPL